MFPSCRTPRRALARVQTGETVAVIENGPPVAVLRPYGLQDPAVYSFRTDPWALIRPPRCSADPPTSPDRWTICSGLASMTWRSCYEAWKTTSACHSRNSRRGWSTRRAGRSMTWLALA
jgi:antitoxin (DNA-binding transcriptional repressor) of toxin-antitoxin stability system